MTNEELAYIAGIFDGEGCVSFTKCRTSSYVRVLIVNTNLELLEYIQECFGGDITKMSRKAGWRQSYQWRLSWSKAIDFLVAIQPWVRIKSDQIALAFCWDHFRVGRGRRLSPEEAEEIYSVNSYIKECFNYLNKRGTHNLEDPIDRVLLEVEWAEGESCH